jgi:hypothetical protein
MSRKITLAKTKFPAVLFNDAPGRFFYGSIEIISCRLYFKYAAEQRKG